MRPVRIHKELLLDVLGDDTSRKLSPGWVRNRTIWTMALDLHELYLGQKSRRNLSSSCTAKYLIISRMYGPVWDCQTS